jgi:hypothetical protein
MPIEIAPYTVRTNQATRLMPILNPVARATWQMDENSTQVCTPDTRLFDIKSISFGPPPANHQLLVEFVMS